jgi:hypothetical protein
MFKPRPIETDPFFNDTATTEIYTVAGPGLAVVQDDYRERLAHVKRDVPIDWSTTPAFAIFHEGASARYAVLCWWGNENEMFTHVSVSEDGTWIHDPLRFSFCLWDLEIMWHERNAFIEHMYSGERDLGAYRAARSTRA